MEFIRVWNFIITLVFVSSYFILNEQFNCIVWPTLFFFSLVSGFCSDIQALYRSNNGSMAEHKWPEVCQPQIKVIPGAKFITDRHCPFVSLWMFDLISVVFAKMTDTYLLFEWTASQLKVAVGLWKDLNCYSYGMAAAK